MKILNLKLENFQGIRDAEFKFDGKSKTIYGDNETGKTTVYNAFTWLLYGRPSTGAKNFTPKTRYKDKDLHKLNHTVEALLQLDSGENIALKRTYKEVYRKPRGAIHEELSGHTTDYFINGVAYTEKNYNAEILNMIGGDSEKSKILTNLFYFPESMEWADRRSILMSVAGDIDSDDVISQSEDLKGLPALLVIPGVANKKYSVDEYKKIATVKKSELAKKIQGIPERIDETKRSIKEIVSLNEVEIKNDIEKLNTNIKAVENEIADLSNKNSATSSILEKIKKLELEKIKIEETHASDIYKKKKEILDKISEHEGKIRSIESEVRSLKNRRNDLDFDIKKIEHKRSSLVEEYNAVFNQNWDETKENCPTCNRPLPKEDIEKIKEEFNKNKSERLQEINESGKKEYSKDIIAEMKKEQDVINEKIKTGIVDIDKEVSVIELLNKEHSELGKVEDSEPHKKLTERIALGYRKLEESKKSSEDLTAGQRLRLSGLKSELSEKESLISQIKFAETQKKRIAELEEEEKQLSSQFEGTEYGLYLCEMFMVNKVKLLTDKINNMFTYVKFRLFVEQQNGGIKEDCEVMVERKDGTMVPYPFANNAARINAGLDIIDVLSKHWKVSMPIFVDNAESVTKIRNTETQLIRLVVSDKHDKLHME